MNYRFEASLRCEEAGPADWPFLALIGFRGFPKIENPFLGDPNNVVRITAAYGQFWGTPGNPKP